MERDLHTREFGHDLTVNLISPLHKAPRGKEMDMRTTIANSGSEHKRQRMRYRSWLDHIRYSFRGHRGSGSNCGVNHLPTSRCFSSIAGSSRPLDIFHTRALVSNDERL